MRGAAVVEVGAGISIGAGGFTPCSVGDTVVVEVVVSYGDGGAGLRSGLISVDIVPSLG